MSTNISLDSCSKVCITVPINSCSRTITWSGWDLNLLAVNFNGNNTGYSISFP